MKIDKIKFSIYTFLLSIGMLFFLYTPIQGAPLKDVPQIIVQPNGEQISCYASGDEYFNWLHDKNGNIIIQDIKTGYYSYAKYKDGELLPSDNIISLIKTKTMNSNSISSNTVTIKDIKIPKKTIQEMSFMNQPIYNSNSNNIENAPSLGTINNVVVYIRFSDEDEFSANTSLYSDMFNNSTSSYSSMSNYFKEVSYNKLTVKTTFYPSTSGSTVVSYRDQYPRAYYQPYSASNQTGYTGGDGGSDRRDREHTLLENASKAISSQLPVGLNIDSDNNGYVDNVCFIVKGSPTGWSSLLWPHKWQLYSRDVYIKNKKVDTYNFQLETALLDSGVGVLCHEMLHSLGYPDLYHYSYDGLSPVGSWDVMEQDLNPPQHTSSYMKYRYGKWIDNITEITEPGIFTLNPLTSPTNNCFKIKSPLSSTEYFVVEYRKKSGTFENSLNGSGLLVYRVNTAMNGNGNDQGPPDELYVFRPGGTTTYDGNVANANLSADVGRSSIGGTSNPIFLSNGKDSGIRISNIGSIGDVINFTISIGESTVAKPTFNLEEATYLGTQQLTMKCSTTGAVIRYTTDGTTPTQTSTVYSGPITISSNQLINAVAFKNGVESDVETANIDIASTLESSHPYENNKDHIWIARVPGATSMTITFDSATKVENFCDGIHVMDGSNNEGAGSPFTDNTLAGKSLTINGDTVKIRLTSDGSVTEWGFKVTNITANSQYEGIIDEPSSYEVVKESIKVKGIYLYTNPITKIQILVDGIVKGEATRFERTDLATAYPEYDLSKAGYEYKLDTIKLSNGKHTIAVKATGSDGTTNSVERSIIVENNLPFKGLIEEPTSSTAIKANLKIKGWYLYGKTISKIEILVDGKSVGTALRLKREDLQSSNLLYDISEAGYEYSLDTTKLSNGKHTISVKASGIDGATNTLPIKTINVVNLTGISLNKTAITMVLRNGRAQDALVAKVMPANASDKEVVWTSSDSNIVSVDAAGKLMALKDGQVIITVATKDGAYNAICKVLVVKTALTSIKLNQSAINLNKTTKVSYNLIATITPSIADYANITWTTSDSSVATVSQDGTVTAVNAGVSTITAKTLNGSKIAICKVNVVPVSRVEIKGNKTMKVGQSQILSATIIPTNAADKSVIWSSMDESIAIVTRYGKVIAVKEGDTEIKAVSKDGNHEYTLSVKVNPVTNAIGVTDMTLTNVKNGMLVIGKNGNLIAKLTSAIKGKVPTNTNILWSSSDESVAIVDDNGKVTPVSKGEVIITAKTTDGSNIEKTCTINVINPVTMVTMDKPSVVLNLSLINEQVVKLNILPVYFAKDAVAWSKSDYVDIVQISGISPDERIQIQS